MSRMLCFRWALYLRSMSPHAEAIGIKTYCIETALPQGRKALTLFGGGWLCYVRECLAPRGFARVGLEARHKRSDFPIHYSRAQLCEDKLRPIQCCRFTCTQKRSEDHCPAGE